MFVKASPVLTGNSTMVACVHTNARLLTVRFNTSVLLISKPFCLYSVVQKCIKYLKKYVSIYYVASGYKRQKCNCLPTTAADRVRVRVRKLGLCTSLLVQPMKPN